MCKEFLVYGGSENHVHNYDMLQTAGLEDAIAVTRGQQTHVVYKIIIGKHH